MASSATSSYGKVQPVGQFRRQPWRGGLAGHCAGWEDRAASGGRHSTFACVRASASHAAAQLCKWQLGWAAWWLGQKGNP
ncbi:hypothetical protein E2562_029179 [Oryza meyeriana var. granulata]|uniref:Uncharacterized protein n=1 Tax=Oryza meyeriana var. granulata TaxID=110450 RepID=A0A6G1E3I2_9ORYZ|nr:hypothetical protein E2562_029179 [Oryza meyeriana var. granulata]